MIQEKKKSLIIDFLRIPEQDGFKKKVIVALRVILTSINRFNKDECLMRASGISYTTIVSLVPMLTVAMALLTITSGFASKKEEYFDYINTFLLDHNILIDINPYLETLNDIVDAATQIGSIGFVFLIFSATAVLRTFESAFNQIWRINSSRTFANKIIFYSFILFIGPLLALVGQSVINNIKNALRSPHLMSVVKTPDNNLWIAGERGTILKIDGKGKKQADLSNLKIDLENLTCLNSEGNIVDICNPPEPSKEHFARVVNKDNNIYTLSLTGVFLSSNDLGKTWSASNFSNTRFKFFAVIDNSSMLMVYESGELLKYNRFGTSIKPKFLNTTNKIRVNRIKFINSYVGFLLDQDGMLWKTVDGGDTFNGKKVSKDALNDIALIDINTMFVVGDKGTILKTFDQGENWVDISHKKISYERIWLFQNKNRYELILLNDLGDILHSNNMGESWSLTNIKRDGKINSMVAVNKNFSINATDTELETNDLPLILNPTETTPVQANVSGGDLIAVGEFKKITMGRFQDDALVWETISGGDSIFSIHSFISFLVPLLSIWLFFVALYSLIPNVRTPVKAVMLGSSITGIILLLFLYSFAIYIRSFSTSTMVIYRALAAVPIFLLSVYCLSMIILLGAEITATLHYKERYLLPENPLGDLDIEMDHSFFKNLKILIYVYQFQKDKNELISLDALSKLSELNPSEFDIAINILTENHYLITNEDGYVAPCKNSSQISIYDLYAKIVKKSFDIPKSEKESQTFSKVSSTFDELDSLSKKHLSSIKFSDLII